MAHHLFKAFAMRRHHFARRLVAVLTPALTLTLAFTFIPAIADSGNLPESGCSGEPSTSQNSPDTAAGEGLKAYVNPDTGELLSEPPGSIKPPADQPTTSQNQADVTVQTRADGTMVADVGDRYLTELRVEMINGRLVTCHRPVEPNQRLQSEDGIERKSHDWP